MHRVEREGDRKRSGQFKWWGALHPRFVHDSVPGPSPAGDPLSVPMGPTQVGAPCLVQCDPNVQGYTFFLLVSVLNASQDFIRSSNYSRRKIGHIILTEIWFVVFMGLLPK